MAKDEILTYLYYIEEISRAPLYNSLEVGFRHSPLTTKEQLERYTDSCSLINQYAVHMIKSIRGQGDV